MKDFATLKKLSQSDDTVLDRLKNHISNTGFKQTEMGKKIEKSIKEARTEYKQKKIDEYEKEAEENIAYAESHKDDKPESFGGITKEHMQKWLSDRDLSKQELKEDVADEGIRFSLGETIDGEKYVIIDEDAIDVTNGQSVAFAISKLLKERFDNLIIANGQYIRVNSTTNREFRESEWARALRKTNEEWYNDKLKSLANADEILTAAKNWCNENIKHERKDNIVSFGRGNVLYKVGKMVTPQMFLLASSRMVPLSYMIYSIFKTKK